MISRTIGCSSSSSWFPRLVVELGPAAVPGVPKNDRFYAAPGNARLNAQRPIRLRQLRTSNLALQHPQLMTEQQDFAARRMPNVLEPVVAT